MCMYLYRELNVYKIIHKYYHPYICVLLLRENKWRGVGERVGRVKGDGDKWHMKKKQKQTKTKGDFIFFSDLSRSFTLSPFIFFSPILTGER